MLVLVAAPAGAQTRTGQQVGAGALLARTTDKPWRLVFLERSGRTALSELPGAGLGFLSASGWARVTRVLRGRRSGRAYAATLATDDPLGRRVALRVAPDGEGVIALRAKVTGTRAGGVSRVGIGFRAPAGAGAGEALPPGRPGRDHLLQPNDLHRPYALRRGGGAGRAGA